MKVKPNGGKKRLNLGRLVLETAWQGRWAGYQDADATRPELLVACYGWVPGGVYAQHEATGQWGIRRPSFRNEQKAPVRWPFKAFAHIPERQRDAAYAALARTLKRLRDKGWLVWGRGGYRLTDVGWAWTARMLDAPNAQPVTTGTALMRSPGAAFDDLKSRVLKDARDSVMRAAKDGTQGLTVAEIYTVPEILKHLDMFAEALGGVAPETRAYVAQRLRDVANVINGKEQ